jgi:hypothetical protein
MTVKGWPIPTLLPSSRLSTPKLVYMYVFFSSLAMKFTRQGLVCNWFSILCCAVNLYFHLYIIAGFSLINKSTRKTPCVCCLQRTPILYTYNPHVKLNHSRLHPFHSVLPQENLRREYNGVSYSLILLRIRTNNPSPGWYTE